VSEDFFGPLISSWDVETAAISTLRTWFPTYLAELERQHGLRPKTIPRPPSPESYHGGEDAESFFQEILPEVVVVANPTGEAERFSESITQCFELQVMCLWIGTGSELAERAEDEARAVASYLGSATMLLAQQPSLGGLAENTILIETPVVSLPNPDARQIAQVVTVFHTFVNVIDPTAGPLQPLPEESPQYGGEPEAPFEEVPEVKETKVTIIAEKI
jgi:hypothetical protein